LSGVGRWHVPPIKVEAGRVGGRLDRDHPGEAVGLAQREIQRNVPTKGRAHEDRILEFKRIAEGDDEIDVVVGAELVLLLPPFLVEWRLTLAMAREVVGNDPVVPRDIGILKQVAPLHIVAAGGMLADQKAT
jgi:hypothetical protein